MSQGEIRKKVNRGLAWVGAASTLVGVLDIVAYALILSFWVDKTEFGVAALVIAWFPVLDLATDLGLHAAVIQKDDHSPEKISTVFWLNLALSGTLAAGVGFGLGPLMAYVYEHPVLSGLLAAYGAKLVWQNTYFMPYALMEKELRFAELSVIRVCANVAEFVGKVGFAWGGFGIWCFVLGPLCRVLVTAVGVQVCHPWRPLFVFRFREAMDWLKFGLFSSSHRILYHAYTNVDYLVVGKYFGPTATGLYTLAYKLVLEPAFVIAGIFNRIAFPAFSRLKADREQLARQLLSFARLNLVITLSFLAVVFIAAEDILLSFWGKEWIEAAPIVRILCGVGVLRALSYLLPPLLDGVGRPELSLRYNALAAILMPALFILGARYLGPSVGHASVAIAWSVGYPVAFLMLLTLALRLLHMKLSALALPLGRLALWACLAGVAGWGAMQLATGWAALPRLILAAATTLSVFALLLGLLEGIHYRGIRGALKG